MDSFAGKLAVVTGGGSGMGRELVIKLAAQGCAVAACDVRQAAAEETAALARAVAPDGTTVTAHACDVADEAQVARFRDEALAAHGAGNHGTANHVDLVFLPLLMKSPEGVLVNTSSVNGFWASLGAGIPHTAYSTAKFAVKGFSEALIEDLRISAPHVRVVLVMPGHVATNIVTNSLIAFGVPEKDAMEAGQGFYDTAPLSAAGAADVILDGVRSGAWRVLVGEDAHRLDQYVRAHPEDAYNYEKMSAVLSGSLTEDPARFGADWLGDDVPRPGQVP